MSKPFGQHRVVLLYKHNHMDLTIGIVRSRLLAAQRASGGIMPSSTIESPDLALLSRTYYVASGLPSDYDGPLTLDQLSALIYYGDAGVTAKKLARIIGNPSIHPRVQLAWGNFILSTCRNQDLHLVLVRLAQEAAALSTLAKRELDTAVTEDKPWVLSRHLNNEDPVGFQFWVAFHILADRTGFPNGATWKPLMNKSLDLFQDNGFDF